MVIMIKLENVMGQEVSTSLEQPLDSLEPGAPVFFLRDGQSAESTHIRLSHPQAQHQPSYHISWITEDGQFMLISPRRVDPDSDDDTDVRTLVALVAANAFEILPADRLTAGAAIMRREIERLIDQGPTALEQHLHTQVVKYLSSQ